MIWISERVIILCWSLPSLLKPPESSSIAAIKNDDSGLIKAKASQQLMRTVVEMVGANIALSDLQILIEPDTGKLLHRIHRG